MTIHLALKEQIDGSYGDALVGPVELKQDALLIRLGNGVTAELRFASGSEYVIGWSWGEAELRIDTAPLHPELATFPNHFHDAQGNLRGDTVTRPGLEPWDNARRMIDALLRDPLLQSIEESK